MDFRRMPIEIESPEERGFANLDCNLTESSFTDQSLGDLGVDLERLLLSYVDHRGHPALRAAIAGDGPGLRPDDVLVTPGAAAALFIVASTLLAPGKHLVVIRPNYATNLETPRALGADLDILDLRFEEGWRVDLDRLAALIRSDTAYVSLTCPHNPTGTMLSSKELEAVVALVERRGTRLLLDETYREMGVPEPLPAAASLSERVIGVSSLSKTYGVPGIRIGWLATRDHALAERFLAAKEQILICGSALDEEIGARLALQRPSLLTDIRRQIALRRTIVTKWMADEALLEWVPPTAGVACFPRIRQDAAVDAARFYQILNEVHGTFVGPGHWFEQEPRYFRIGFGWPSLEALRRGLANVSTALRAAREA
jgi:aspartate/methionine/tyrosine aminotransferase